MMNGLGRVSAGTGVVLPGEEKPEEVFKENTQNSMDFPQYWTDGLPGKIHSHPNLPP